MGKKSPQIFSPVAMIFSMLLIPGADQNCSAGLLNLNESRPDSEWSGMEKKESKGLLRLCLLWQPKI
jgi:hypothetical protein